MAQNIPHDRQNDYTLAQAQARRAFIHQLRHLELNHLAAFSFSPEVLPGNIENFIGVAQVPIGLAGPLWVRGQAAQGEFFVPLATTEGTLVASYSRGMKLCHQAGGIMSTVIDEAMQRAPLFVFENARYAQDFGEWVSTHFEAIKAQAESTTQTGKLKNIEQYAAGKMRWLRFNFQTGDAAGQNMVTKATHKACFWMIAQGLQGLEHFTLAANFDTDKKHSHLNTLQTRGKRVVAEITLPAELVQSVLHTRPEALHYQRQLSNAGAFLSGSVNNGSHFANALAAIFIATGQDVANVAESSAGLVHGEITSRGDYYFSVTIPSLIVATYGGGTGLPTQRECLEIMDCYGPGKALKLAEIVAATVLCGELSLSAAIVANEWVASHEQYGRNRP
ncbi:MAG: hydroxymethylglutaryl-CoA reductase [Microscillaceae bacterium]|nr:hydroxymethylglutaryl-CoA reductase [Microscillaceae bacterium]